MTRLTAAGCICLAVAGCGDADVPSSAARPYYPVPGCETLDHTPCDARAVACQERMFVLAACLRGEAPGNKPVVTVVTEAQFAEYLEDAYANEAPRPDPDHWERAMTLLGVAAPGAFSDATRIEDRVKHVWGVYRHKTKDVLVIDHQNDTPPEWTSALLIHEYIHALQDRGVGLAELHQGHGTYDAALATNAVVEGEAELHEARYGASMLGLDPATVDLAAYFQSRVENDEAKMVEDESPYTASWRTFPYSVGGRYMHFTWRAGRLEAVLQRFASPPTYTQVLMASDEDAAQVVFDPVLPSAVSLRNASVQAESVLGAWGTFLVLIGALDDVERARDLALGWRGDEIRAYGSDPADDPASETALVWRLELVDEDTAAEMAAALGGEAAGTRVEVKRSTAAPATSDDEAWPFTDRRGAGGVPRSDEVEPLRRVLANEALHRRHDLLCGPVELLGVGATR